MLARANWYSAITDSDSDGEYWYLYFLAEREPNERMQMLATHIQTERERMRRERAIMKLDNLNRTHEQHEHTFCLFLQPIILPEQRKISPLFHMRYRK